MERRDTARGGAETGERERAATGESHSDVTQGVGWYIHEMMEFIM